MKLPTSGTRERLQTVLDVLPRFSRTGRLTDAWQARLKEVLATLPASCLTAESPLLFQAFPAQSTTERTEEVGAAFVAFAAFLEGVPQPHLPSRSNRLMESVG